MALPSLNGVTGSSEYTHTQSKKIFQDTDVASKLFYSYGFLYGCQLWELSSKYIEDIVVAWQKAIGQIYQHLNVSRLALKLSLPNSLKPGVKSQIKM